MNSLARLRRHLSFANVIACVALFAALGGGAYAAGAGKINGSRILSGSIGGAKLKNGTITSRKIKKGALNGSVINLSTLGTVPSAQTAVTATSAASATTATTATKAQSAVRATSAESAAKATKATTATNAANATNAEHARTADTATSAGSAASAKKADEATRATTAGDADTLNGRSAAELTVRCPASTELFGGMCWDVGVRPIKTWVGASIECAEAGGRLPSLSELVAFVARPGPQVSGQNWSGDVGGLAAPNVKVLTSDESARAEETETATLGFRCLFYRTN